jgi:hypothetical protein
MRVLSYYAYAHSLQDNSHSTLADRLACVYILWGYFVGQYRQHSVMPTIMRQNYLNFLARLMVQGRVGRVPTHDVKS